MKTQMTLEKARERVEWWGAKYVEMYQSDTPQEYARLRPVRQRAFSIIDRFSYPNRKQLSDLWGDIMRTQLFPKLFPTRNL